MRGPAGHYRGHRLAPAPACPRRAWHD